MMHDKGGAKDVNHRKEKIFLENLDKVNIPLFIDLEKANCITRQVPW